MEYGDRPSDREELEDALGSDRLLLHYQPIHELGSHDVVTVEALLRQRGHDGVPRSAPRVTAAAEAGSQVVDFDDWVVAVAFRDAAAWQQNGFPNVRLNVNLSPREFEREHDDLVLRLDRAAEESGIDASRVTLEITETRYFANPEETAAALDEIRKRGYQLWMDDFGEGHATMALLRHFPVDGLKIPGSFIKELLTDRRCRAIVESTVVLAQKLGLRVVAEEVETDEQLQVLKAIGCDFAQGYLFSRAMPADALRAFLAR